jgi:alanine racemase
MNGGTALNPIIEVDQNKLSENLATIQGITRDNVKIMAIIKSNAYGHGILEIAKALSFQVDCFGVGFFNEALALREQGIIQDILVLGPSYDFALAIENKITITVESIGQGLQLFDFVEKNLMNTSKKISIHIKVDTGFGRFGFREKDLKLFLEQYKKYEEYIMIRGFYSHIATTKSGDDLYVQKQNERFIQYKMLFEDFVKFKHVIFHLANSEIAIDYPSMHYDMIRIGNALFGPVNSKKKIVLKRVARLMLPVVSVHERKKGDRIGYGLRYRFKKNGKMGVIESGFYEGIGLEKSPLGQSIKYRIIFYMKSLIKAMLRKDYVNYKNVKLPIIGMVNMQFTMVDVSDVNIEVGDFVELIKSPLYIKENVERRHILEGNHGISNES